MVLNKFKGDWVYLNEPKSALINLNELRWASISLIVFKWTYRNITALERAQISVNESKCWYGCSFLDCIQLHKSQGNLT